jgi:hypothetical protein
VKLRHDRANPRGELAAAACSGAVSACDGVNDEPLPRILLTARGLLR